MIIVEDAANQLPVEVARLTEHIVVAHRIDFQDLQEMGTGKYVNKSTTNKSVAKFDAYDLLTYSLHHYLT